MHGQAKTVYARLSFSLRDYSPVKAKRRKVKTESQKAVGAETTDVGKRAIYQSSWLQTT